MIMPEFPEIKKNKFFVFVKQFQKGYLPVIAKPKDILSCIKPTAFCSPYFQQLTLPCLASTG